TAAERGAPASRYHRVDLDREHGPRPGPAHRDRTDQRVPVVRRVPVGPRSGGVVLGRERPGRPTRVERPEPHRVARVDGEDRREVGGEEAVQGARVRFHRVLHPGQGTHTVIAPGTTFAWRRVVLSRAPPSSSYVIGAPRST